MTSAVPLWRELDHPRPLTTDERSALREVIGRVGSASLSAQAATARVSAPCACGCSSVRLDVTEAPLGVDEMSRLEPRHRDDYASVERFARDSSGVHVAVILHLVDGRMHELEFFAGEGIAVSWPLTWT